MSKRHFPVTEWEPGDPVDEEHLATCEECRTEWRLMEFLRFQIDSIPRPSPSPYFAAKTIRRIENSSVSFWIFVDRLAKILVPTFATAAFAATVLLFNLNTGHIDTDEYSQVLLEPTVTEEMTLDDVVVQLLEENGN